jgi:16S rRNA (cytosine1402-N4)-methyltransferase
LSLEHQPVLLAEALDWLAIQPDGSYLDATFGRGGHSRAILEGLGEQGRLLVMDKDPAAIKVARALAQQDRRCLVHQGSFADMGRWCDELGAMRMDGVLLDLGVSSPQLDEAGRGFSFLRDGPLDMRMDPQRGESAAQWLARVAEAEMVQVLRDYGEERFAKRIAAAICKARTEQAIVTTGQLAEIVKAAHPAWEKGRHPATRAFQAIRIQINNELEDLRLGLAQSLDILKPGGRLVVIAFHSLEDRLVKRFIRDEARGDALPLGLPVTSDQQNARLKSLGAARRASEAELALNPRARSAVMRGAVRL